MVDPLADLYTISGRQLFCLGILVVVSTLASAVFNNDTSEPESIVLVDASIQECTDRVLESKRNRS